MAISHMAAKKLCTRAAAALVDPPYLIPPEQGMVISASSSRVRSPELPPSAADLGFLVPERAKAGTGTLAPWAPKPIYLAESGLLGLFLTDDHLWPNACCHTQMRQ